MLYTKLIKIKINAVFIRGMKTAVGKIIQEVPKNTWPKAKNLGSAEVTDSALVKQKELNVVSRKLPSIPEPGVFKVAAVRHFEFCKRLEKDQFSNPSAASHSQHLLLSKQNPSDTNKTNIIGVFTKSHEFGKKKT
jgi:hypothetical protein